MPGPTPTPILRWLTSVGLGLSLCGALAPAWSQPAQAPQSTPGEALPASLLIAEFRIEGNTVLTPELIEATVAPHLGPGKAPADIQVARDALARAYEQAGWQAVAVEAERIDPVMTPDGPGWIAVLRVAEGPVSQLKVSGAAYNLPSKVAQAMPSVQAGRPLDFNRFQQDLARVAQLAGVNVTPVLRPGRDPGTMEVELKLKDELPLAAWAELNNDDSPDTSPRRLELGVRYDNLFQLQHGLTARFINSPLNRHEVEVATLSYSLPLAGDDRLSLYAVHSNSQIQANTGTGVIGKGDTLGLRWTRLFSTTPELQHNLTLGIDVKHLAEDSSATGSRPLHYVPLSGQYTMVLPDDSGRWSIGSSITLGQRWLNQRSVDCQGYGRADQFACKRAGATPDFLRWGATLQREQPLGRWRLNLRAELQLANEPLIGNEQFYLGGADSVRGYYASEQGGDEGARASAELGSPRLTPADSPLDLSALGFVDAGWTRRLQALPGEPAPSGLLGAGLGLRLRWTRHLSGALDWARTFRPGPRTPDNAHRLHGSLRIDF